MTKTPPSLISLLQGLNFTPIAVLPGGSIEDQAIGSVTADSRNVAPGDLFVALAGRENDGHDYIAAAVAAGCRAVVCGAKRMTADAARALQVTVIEVENTPRAYAAIAANYFGHPAEQLRFVGVTGTNGKTTVTYLLEQVLLQAGLAVGVVGTVNNRYTGGNGRQKILATRFTTPEAFLLQQLLREMVDSGVELIIMEVSSHALTQARLGSIMFDFAAFTNLSRDHLDYHTDMDDYFRAKTVLFSGHMRQAGMAVIPVQTASDDREWPGLLHAVCRTGCARTITWGEGEGAEIRLHGFSSSLNQTKMTIESPSGQHTLTSPLVGRYNIDNVLTVYGLCVAMAIDESLVCHALAAAVGAPGRVERVTTGAGWESKGPVVLVDYAHSPDALEKVLATVAALPHGELFCVFGCGGDRDRGKRPLMGEIAGKLCDVLVVTDDNPRSEDPDRIVAEILDGVGRAGLEVDDEAWLFAREAKERGCVTIRDRKQAIDAAIRAASSGDIVLLAGKGHEPYQLTLQGKRFFDDRLEAREVLFSWTAELVAAAAAGRLHPGRKPTKLLGPVMTDSRVSSREGIFVALKGENHDGHDFARQAVEHGAACLVVEKMIALPAELAVCQVVVADTQQALGDLAAFRRRALAGQCDQVVIGLTGSCGKTTVKEMVAAILARMYPEGPDFPTACVLKTRGNFNNLIGLPLSLLPLGAHHLAAVLEMGMNRPGELSRLGAIVDPDISCITNIHGAHLEGLQSIEGVARAKEELFAATRREGVLVINLDDARIRALSGKYPNRKITFAMQVAGNRHGHEQPDEQPDVWASDIHSGAGGVITFTLHYGEETVEIHLSIAGEHNVLNALCAAAIGLAAGASLGQLAAGLADFRPPDKRMQLLQAQSGFTIINDTYNANPASMAAGLQALKKVAGRRSIGIIGDMLELGDSSARAHYDIGKLIAELSIGHVGVVGEFGQDVVHGALEHGYPEECIHLFRDKKDAVSWLHDMVASEGLGREDAVLVKASRGLRFETIIADILEF